MVKPVLLSSQVVKVALIIPYHPGLTFHITPCQRTNHVNISTMSYQRRIRQGFCEVGLGLIPLARGVTQLYPIFLKLTQLQDMCEKIYPSQEPAAEIHFYDHKNSVKN